MSVGFHFNLTFGLNPQVDRIKIVRHHCLQTFHFPSWVAHSHFDCWTWSRNLIHTAHSSVVSISDWLLYYWYILIACATCHGAQIFSQFINFVIGTCLQIISRSYQKECLPTRESCGYCKLVEAFYTGEPSLHWFSCYHMAKLLQVHTMRYQF